MSAALHCPKPSKTRCAARPGTRAATSSRLRRAGRQRRRRRAARRDRARAGAQAAGPVSRSRLPAARFVDRHPPGQHRHVLRRQDRLRPGHRHRVPPDDVRRARHRLRQDHAASWAAPTSPSIRAARAARTRFRPTAGRCAASPPKRGACCSRWRRRGSACRSTQLAVSDGVDHRRRPIRRSASPTAS